MELDFFQTTGFPILVIDEYPFPPLIRGAFYPVGRFYVSWVPFQAIPSLFHSSVYSWTNMLQYFYGYCCWVTKLCLTLSNPMDCSPPGVQPSVHGADFPGKNPGVGCRFLLQGILLAQGQNPCFLHWQVGSLPLSHLGSHIFMETFFFHIGYSKSPISFSLSKAS